MSDELQSANQSAAPTESQAVPVETSAPVASETPTPESTTTSTTANEPSGIKVKFNHEERVIGLEEAPTWIQKGMNYDKLQERATQFEQQAKHLDRVAKFYGFEKAEEYLEALNKAEEEQRIKEEAAKLGVPEDFIRSELHPLKEKIQAFEQKEEELKLKELELEIGAEISRLRESNPDFDQYADKVFEMAKSKGYPLEHAFIIASHQDKVAKAAKEAESQTIRNLQQNAQSATGPLGADAPDQNSGYLALSPSERRALRERVKRGDV
ncbi:hypothetical protein [Cohnella sp. AR92]|uniref:hypothetical protein n=1 Tax=Cohnella sp. AR92 TaxID=648716 RepID=UPI000F8C9D88|nr:hypothetical protein [Cohnella sp. AR92]RUS42275.1 hypothetical protein ELR57_27060 [Cohnella sp. AR92]